MERLNKFFRLPAADRRFLLKVMFLVWTVRIGLWLLPFQVIREFLAKLGRGSVEAQREGHALIDRIVWAVTLTSDYVPAATCLTQALVTKILLNRHGYRARVRLGVAQSETGQFQAHAWVESNGAIVIGGSELFLKHYTPLPLADEEII